MSAFATFAVAGAITAALRCSMVVLGPRMLSSVMVDSMIKLVAPAVLSAIIVSALALDRGHLVGPDPVGVVAVVAAFGAVRRTSNVSMALAVGLPTYWCGTGIVAMVGGG